MHASVDATDIADTSYSVVTTFTVINLVAYRPLTLLQERSRGAFYMSKSEYDAAKAQFNSLQQSFQVRIEGQRSQVEYENLKIEIQNRYIADIDKEIAQNSEAMDKIEKIHGGDGAGHMLQETLRSMEKIGQRAESRKKALLIAVEEMRRLRDKIADRTAVEEARDAKLLAAAEDPVAVLKLRMDTKTKLFKETKERCDDEQIRVDRLESERNALSAELSSMSSRMGSVVHLKFDISQEISDYNVAISTYTSIFNAIVGVSGIIYHSWKYYLFRAEMKEDTHNFIESVKRDAAAENTEREDIKDMLTKISDLLDNSTASHATNAAPITSKPTAAALRKEEEHTSSGGTQTAADSGSAREKLLRPPAPLAADSGRGGAADIDATETPLADGILNSPHGPALCFLGVLLVCRCLVGT
jgi:hypothetical protein